MKNSFESPVETVQPDEGIENLVQSPELSHTKKEQQGIHEVVTQFKTYNVETDLRKHPEFSPFNGWN